MENGRDEKELIPIKNSIQQTQVHEVLDNEFLQKQTWLGNLNMQLNAAFAQLIFIQNKVNWSNQESIRIQQEAIDKYREIKEKADIYDREIKNAYEESMKKINSLKDEIRDLEIQKVKLKLEIKMLKSK
jgi:hypothetical protein